MHEKYKLKNHSPRVIIPNEHKITIFTMSPPRYLSLLLRYYPPSCSQSVIGDEIDETFGGWCRRVGAVVVAVGGLAASSMAASR